MPWPRTAQGLRPRLLERCRSDRRHPASWVAKGASPASPSPRPLWSSDPGYRRGSRGKGGFAGPRPAGALLCSASHWQRGQDVRSGHRQCADHRRSRQPGLHRRPGDQERPHRRDRRRARRGAGGLVLAPGIIDLHTPFDAQLTWDPFARPSPALGVTTVVIGNCGFTIAPCRPEDRDRTLRNLTHVEGMSLAALRAGVDWGFETYPQYLDMLATKGMVPNVASFCGHSSVRGYVLGPDASRSAATRAEVAEMKGLVIEALRAGAVGFATTTLEQHNGENGVPMPSRLADEYEMLELTAALGEVGRGVFMLTKGMTTTVPWLERIAANSGRPVMIAAMFVDPNDPQRVFREFAEIAAARERGRELWGQVGCFPLGMEFSLAHPYPLEAFLAWRPAIEAEGSQAYREVLADPAFRAAIKAEARTTGVPNRFSYRQFPHMRVLSVTRPENRGLID